MKVAHLTTVHQRYDTRIFVKQCNSLAVKGYNVTLIVADGKGDELKNGINILDAGKPANRISRMVLSTRKVYGLALKTGAEIYHLHDPELMPIGLLLKQKKKTVIFDAHEDVSLQLLNKPYLTWGSGWLLSKSYSLFEKTALSRFDAIVAATPVIREKFSVICKRVVDINNFPLLAEFIQDKKSIGKKAKKVCYIGGYTSVRGVSEIVQSMSLTGSNIRLLMGGMFFEKSFEQEVKSLSGWQMVDDRGFLDRTAIRNLLSESFAGLVTLHPIPNYLESLPVKMFEYMAAGIPVIASDFPYWREIIESNKCGICVNPLKPSRIAEAINFLAMNPEAAQTMGQNGRKAVEEKYNWEKEEKKLHEVYSKFQLKNTDK